MAKSGEFVMSEHNSRLMSIGEVAKSLHYPTHDPQL